MANEEYQRSYTSTSYEAEGMLDARGKDGVKEGRKDIWLKPESEQEEEEEDVLWEKKHDFIFYILYDCFGLSGECSCYCDNLTPLKILTHILTNKWSKYDGIFKRPVMSYARQHIPADKRKLIRLVFSKVANIGHGHFLFNPRIFTHKQTEITSRSTI